jgi:hypothetical protein
MDYSKLANAVVIHTRGDDTTYFLRPIYERWPAVAVDAEDNALAEYLSKYRVIAMGHGGSDGLFDAGYQCILHAGHVEALRHKSDNVFIWCYASEFMRSNQLRGFATGMFISETREAAIFGIEASEDEIKNSNELFASILGDCLHLSSAAIYSRVLGEYSISGNKIVEYNRERMYFAA